VNKFLKGLLGAGLYLLEQSELASRSARERAVDQFEDLRDSAEARMREATRRVSKASRAIQGKDDSPLTNFLLFTAGFGVGVGAGLLFAPASGADVRSAMSGKVQEFTGKFKTPAEPYSTGTRG
jgi:murein DD-endopeptidase MepM/ murein hydrolase activator NlpD